MTTLIDGLLGGLVVSVVAALPVRAVESTPSATAVLVGAVTGSRDVAGPRARGPGRYGAVAGVALVALELFVLGLIAVPPTPAEAVGLAVGWSLVLFAALLAAWRVLPDRPAGSPLAELFVYHLVYGFGLGVRIRLTWIT
jgi:hypothetical protein